MAGTCLFTANNIRHVGNANALFELSLVQRALRVVPYSLRQFCAQRGGRRAALAIWHIVTPPAKARGMLGSLPQPTPRLPEGPARPVAS
jgi:hypothetical protein